MRLIFLCLLLLNFQGVFGQVFCDSDQNIELLGDYPPGCNMCIPFLSGNNIGYTADDTISYDFPCGKIENSIWYSFYSRGEGMGAFRIMLNECSLGKGVEFAIFDEDLNRVSDCIVISDKQQGTIRIPLPTRKLFYIMIDGIDGDECEFGIFNSLPSGTLSDDIYVTPSGRYCTGAKVCLKRDRDFVSETYEWQIPAGDSIISGGLDEEEVCIQFKSDSTKDFSLKVSNSCFDRAFSKSIFVMTGQTVSVQSFTVDQDTICEGEQVQFTIVMEDDFVGFDWDYSTSDFQVLSGGWPNDTFLRAKVLRDGNHKMIVMPDVRCGLRTEENIVGKSISNQFLDRFVCNEGCYPLGDSCYNFAEFRAHRVHVGENVNGCDSFVQLFLRTIDILPSPNINCKQTNDGIMIEWERVSGAVEYVVYANRDSVTTVIGGSYFLENAMINMPLVVKVQPIGECTYLPAEINCDFAVSNSTDDFLSRKIKVFPNPTTGNINIETELKLEEVEVYNASGRILQKEKTTSFELRNRESGIYFLKIKTNEGVGVKRIIVDE